MGDQSNDTKFIPPLFSLVNITFNLYVDNTELFMLKGRPRDLRHRCSGS